MSRSTRPRPVVSPATLSPVEGRQRPSLVRTSIALAFGLFALSGCATKPAVRSDLPISKVVIYRNGVAYFEREGETREKQLSFRVRPDHVGDFLASLAVMEEGGSPVRAASFPLTSEDVEVGEEGSEPSDRRLSTVTLELDGAHHALTVGYIAEQPVWKPSYRLIFEGGKPMLQAWGIVQNVSGEDWRDVQLSLIAGAPISFQSTLGVPVTPVRPIVSDSGEVIAAVPRSETTLAQDAPAPPPPPTADAPTELARPSAPMATQAPQASRSARKRAPQQDDALRLQDAYGAEEERSGQMAPRDLALLASRTVQAGTTRYDVPTRVTIPKDSATMVLLIAQEVPGESVFMFAPEPGVPDSARHPFRVARFKNDSTGILERGPLAVFENGAFLGQGVLETLSAQGEATVPFALARELALDREQRWDTLEARLAKIESGQLMIERDRVLHTTYRLRNGGQEDARVLVRHPRLADARLHAPPEGTEDQVGKGTALVPTSVKPHASATLVVDERSPFSTYADWFSNEAGAAVKAYAEDPRADAALVKALGEAWVIRERVIKAREESAKLRSQSSILERAAAEVRSGLSAISRSTSGVAALRKRLSDRLIELDDELSGIRKRLVELELGLNEDIVRFNESVRELKLSAPLPQPKAG